MMRDCPACGWEISEHAPACPQCGHSMRWQSAGLWVSAFMAVAILLTVAMMIWAR